MDRTIAFKYFYEEINRSAQARNPYVESPKFGGNPTLIKDKIRIGY